MRYFYFLLCVAAAAPLDAQSLEIHSEFQRINPFGQVVSVDRSGYPREILSPEVPRNAHSVFHVSVTVPHNTSYFLYVGTNPPNLISATLYKEDFTQIDGEWIPDALSPVRQPAFGFMPDASAGISGQTTRCYLLDLWVPAQIDVQRVRVEVLMKIGIWFVAPMEVRIVEAKVPLDAARTMRQVGVRNRGDLPDIGDRIDSSATECLSRYLLGRPPQPIEDGDLQSVREAVRRSAEQDMAIASRQPRVPQAVWFLAANGFVESWMRNPGIPDWSGPEWYLKVRDWIYRNTKGE